MELNGLTLTIQMPPLPSPMDESQHSPRAEEDSETDASADDTAMLPNATKTAEVIETPTTNRATANDEADDAVPDSSVIKMKLSEVCSL